MGDTFRSEDSGEKRSRSDPCCYGHDYVERKSWTETETEYIEDKSADAFWSGDRTMERNTLIRVTEYKCSRCGDVTENRSSNR